MMEEILLHEIIQWEYWLKRSHRSHRSRTHPNYRQHRCEWCWIYLPVDFKSASIVNIVVENGDLLFLHLLFLSRYVVCKYLMFGLLNRKLYNYLFPPFMWWLISSTIMMQSFAQHSPFSVLFLFWNLEFSGKTVWNMTDFSELCI